MSGKDRDANMKVECVTERDADEVIAMLRKSFFVLEPLNSSIGLAGPDGSCPELEEYCRQALATGYSMLVRAEDGGVEGVILNAVLRRGEVPGPDDSRVRDGDSKFDRVMAVNHAIEHLGDVFREHPDVAEALDVKILATDPARAKRGVGTVLMERTVELARSRGLQLMRCVCSGAFSARIAQRLGMARTAELPYCEFLGPDGRPVFAPPAPHTAITCWALRL